MRRDSYSKPARPGAALTFVKVAKVSCAIPAFSRAGGWQAPDAAPRVFPCKDCAPSNHGAGPAEVLHPKEGRDEPPQFRQPDARFGGFLCSPFGVSAALCERRPSCPGCLTAPVHGGAEACGGYGLDSRFHCRASGRRCDRSRRGTGAGHSEGSRRAFSGCPARVCLKGTGRQACLTLAPRREPSGQSRRALRPAALTGRRPRRLTGRSARRAGHCHS